MQQGETLHLLVSCESQSQLEACTAVFRDAGWGVRAHRVSSLRDLADMLRDPQWDLLIASEKHPEVAPNEALAALKQSSQALSCIVRAQAPDEARSNEWMQAGARDVVGEDPQRLLLVALREIAALREHRELETLRVQYAETARRCELLLAASQDAIAYVIDGMHVHANELYAGMFGYADVDELASVPLVDLIAADRQQPFKEALRSYRDRPEEQTTIEIHGLRADGSEFGGSLVLSTASFEGEPCMQVMVRAASAASAPAAAPVAAGTSVGSGAEALAAALSSASGGQLLLVSVDGFNLHCRNLGFAAANRLVDELGAFICKSRNWPQPIRASDATLAFRIAQANSETASADATAAVAQVAAHIHEIGNRSLTCSIAVTVCPLDDASDSSVEALIDRAWSAMLATAERAQSLRGADPARVELLNKATTGTATAATGDSGQSLEAAIKAGEFRILFQPIVSLRGDTSEYYEVVPVHGDERQAASEWLAQAQLGDAGAELDQWVVSESLQQLAAHRSKHPDTRLILPLGSASILDADFPTWFAVALRAAELPPDSIVIQISHVAASPALKQATRLAEQMRALGCQLSVADVHSANNPIPDLTHLRPQFARVDPALARSLGDSETTNTLLKPLVESLHQEQIASIMPCVEGASVMAVLWQLGVNFIQGDYLQAPTPAMQYEFTDLA